MKREESICILEWSAKKQMRLMDLEELWKMMEHGYMKDSSKMENYMDMWESIIIIVILILMVIFKPNTSMASLLITYEFFLIN